MKNLVLKVLFGRDQVSGLLAIGIVALFVLGCTCGKDFKLGDLSDNSNSSSTSNSSKKTTSDKSDKSERTSDNPFGKDSEDSDIKSDGDMPSQSTVKSLVRDTTSNFANAVESEDFSELYNDSADQFKASNTP